MIPMILPCVNQGLCPWPHPRITDQFDFFLRPCCSRVLIFSGNGGVYVTTLADKRQAETSQKGPEHSASVVVLIDGQRMTLTREQEALIRSWAAGPV